MKRTLSLPLRTILLATLLAACGNQVTPVSSNTPPLPSATPTVMPTVMPTSTASPAPEVLFQELRKNWRVAYEQANQVCAMYGDGSGKLCTPLVKAYQFLWGSWSPDGNRLIFTGNDGLYIWRLDGGITPFRVISGTVSANPDWSPDGKYIAFESTELERSLGQHYAMDIFVNNLDGTIHRNITRYLSGDSDSLNPGWSPDGSLIAFDSNGTKPNPDYPVNPWPFIYDDTEIYVVSPDGSNPVSLTHNEAEDVQPLWSPDGRQIAFLSDRNGSYDLHIMNADGTEPRQVAHLALDNPRYGYDNYSWLPDGKFILFNDQLIDLESGGISGLSFPFSAYGGTWLMVDTDSTILPIPTPHCAYGWSRLYVDAYAVVSGGPSDPPNRVRSGPSTTAEIIHQIYPGMIVKVLEGPVCADGLVFWKVGNGTIPGGSGWTAEGDGTEYYLEPQTP